MICIKYRFLPLATVLFTHNLRRDVVKDNVYFYDIVVGSFHWKLHNLHNLRQHKQESLSIDCRDILTKSCWWFISVIQVILKTVKDTCITETDPIPTFFFFELKESNTETKALHFSSTTRIVLDMTLLSPVDIRHAHCDVFHHVIVAVW